MSDQLISGTPHIVMRNTSPLNSHDFQFAKKVIPRKIPPSPALSHYMRFANSRFLQEKYVTRPFDQAQTSMMFSNRKKLPTPQNRREIIAEYILACHLSMVHPSLSIAKFAHKPNTGTTVSINPDFRIGSRIGFPVTNFAFGQVTELRSRIDFQDPTQFHAVLPLEPRLHTQPP